MKIKFVLLLTLGIFLIESCQNKSEDKEVNKETKSTDLISGTWTLYSEVINGKQIDHSGKPTAVSLTFKDNGYYIFFDKITDEKISDSGVDKIQVRYKGQYEIKDKMLIMNQFENDSLITNNYLIKNLTETEFSIQDQKTKNIRNFKK